MIDSLIEEIKKVGVLGAKISGAGGGGFISCYVDPRKRRFLQLFEIKKI